MKFKIAEISGQGEVSKKEAEAFLKKHCSEYLKISKQHGIHLYRGMGHESAEYLIKTPRTNRDPKDTPSEIHQLLDDALFRKFGWRPRSEGVFVFGDTCSADHYGNVYAIFPQNGFKCVWSYDVADFYEYSHENIDGWVNTKPKLKKFLDNLVEDAYQEGDIAAAAIYDDGQNEIMIKCDKYVAMRV